MTSSIFPIARKTYLFNDLGGAIIKTNFKNRNYKLIIPSNKASSSFVDFTTKLILAKSYDDSNNKSNSYGGKLIYKNGNSKRKNNSKSNVNFESVTFKNGKYKLILNDKSIDGKRVPNKIKNAALKYDPITNYYATSDVFNRPWEQTVKAGESESNSDGYTKDGVNPKIDILHIFHGERSGNVRGNNTGTGRPTGYHSSAIDLKRDKEFIDPVINNATVSNDQNAQGVYRTGWKFKTPESNSKKNSTMWPDGCTGDQVVNSIRHAYKTLDKSTWQDQLPANEKRTFTAGPSGPVTNDSKYCYGIDNNQLNVMLYQNEIPDNLNSTTTIRTSFPQF